MVGGGGGRLGAGQQRWLSRSGDGGGAGARVGRERRGE